jgi:hypothetical protein
MKNILLLTVMLLLTGSNRLLAQNEGKRFISGSAGIGAGTFNPKDNEAVNSYSLNIDLELGKFKTNTRASGWLLRSSLLGGKQAISTNNGIEHVSGIQGFSLGGGHFWQFYKHFNTNFGIFGGPDVNLLYSYERKDSNAESGLNEEKIHNVTASLGLSAGAYYKLNERWWLLGSLAVAQPLRVAYRISEMGQVGVDDSGYTQNHFEYEFSPNITFPSVSLGVRYFFKD